MSLYFDRRIRVSLPSAQAASAALGVVDVSGGVALDAALKYKFSVEKRRGSKKPDSLKLEVYNLSATTFSHLAADKQRIVLQAGYSSATETSALVSELPTLFDGEIFYAKRERSGSDIVATVEARAVPSSFSGHVVATAAGRVSMTAVLNETLSKIFSDPSVNVGIGQQNLGQDVVLSNGVYFDGTYTQVLNSITDILDCDQWIEDGKLHIVNRASQADTAAVLLSQSSGLIGIPAKTKIDLTALRGKNRKQTDGWTVKSLLNGTIRQGRIVTVDSHFAGKFTVGAYSVVHTGETDGQDWYTEFTGIPV